MVVADSARAAVAIVKSATGTVSNFDTTRCWGCWPTHCFTAVRVAASHCLVYREGLAI